MWMKCLELVLFYLILFLTDISLTKWKSFFTESWLLSYCLDRQETRQLCDKVVDTCLPALIFLPIGLLQINVWKRHNMVFCNDNIDFDTFMLLNSLVIVWALILKSFIRLTLMMTIFVKMILKVLFLLEFSVGIKDLKNVKHVKTR